MTVIRRHDGLLFWVLDLHVLEHPACSGFPVFARAGMCLCPLGATVLQVAWSEWVTAPVGDCVQVLLADAAGHRGLRSLQKVTAQGSEKVLWTFRTKIGKQYMVRPESAVLGPGIPHLKWPSEYREFQVLGEVG